jgi:hypothetical protein
MIRRNILPALIIFILTGCAASPAISATLPASSTPAIERTFSPTATQPSVLTPTATPEARFTRQCLQIKDEVELKEVTSGTILFYIPPPDDLPYLKDIQTGIEYKLPAVSKNSERGNLQISPDEKMLALMEWVYNDQHVRISTILWVVDARASILARISIKRADLGQLRWLDNERLIIDTEKYGTLLLVNPFTGEQKVISNELPNLYPYFSTGRWWPVVYSPDLEWVAYYSARTENGDYIEGPVVYDLVTKQVLWGAGNGVGSNPAWSPDGREVAFTSGMGKNQPYLINRSGQAKTVLSENLPHKAFELSWSPDGRYIAFWNANNLIVYDRQMDWVFNTCISGYESGVTTVPSWSPDSQQIIVHGYSTHPILVNWQEKLAYKIKDMPNIAIIGWMNSQP